MRDFINQRKITYGKLRVHQAENTDGMGRVGPSLFSYFHLNNCSKEKKKLYICVLMKTELKDVNENDE